MKNIALILLSGCGTLDGSNPFETVLFSELLESYNFEVIFASLSRFQFNTVNHLSLKQQKSSKRNMLFESARISNGKIFDLKDLSPKLPKACILVGGQGVIKNFIDNKGNPLKDVSKFLREFHNNQGVIIAVSLGVSLLSSSFKEYNFDFDLLQMKSGTYLVNKDKGFIVSPGSIASSSLSILRKEFENDVREAVDLIK